MEKESSRRRRRLRLFVMSRATQQDGLDGLVGLPRQVGGGQQKQRRGAPNSKCATITNLIYEEGWRIYTYAFF